VSAVSTRRPATRVRPVAPPDGVPRLLAGWYATSRRAGLREHVERHGPLPVDHYRGRRGRGLLLDLVDGSGLYGRGGAGFPTARKLRAVAAGRGRAVVVANGAEGEPASGKDALLLTAAPHLVIDGAVLAALAVGAAEVHLVVGRRATRALESVELALAERGRAHVDPVPVHLHALPDRYVAGQETALVQWLGGGPAKPTTTPPRPYERGLRGRPTLVQNVETLAHLSLIARHGDAWFRTVGTQAAPGTTLLTVTGAVAHPGVVEVALGTSLGAAIAPCAPSAPQAVLVGGHFGAWVPWQTAAALPLTPAGLQAAGSALGAGVVVVLPEAACGIVETTRIARYLARESAGQCGPCRFGLAAIADDMTALSRAADTTVRARLERRLAVVAGRGACQHPDGAIRLVASALRVFAADVERHERSGPCAAARGRPVVPVPRPADEQEWR
jgi:NADH:ubiquinone oxidoreductase subunit F (NADH-binding)